MNEYFASLTPPGRLAPSIGHFFSAWFQEIDQTVPGSSDGVLLMGVLIVLIIVIPIVTSRRRWMR